MSLRKFLYFNRRILVNKGLFSSSSNNETQKFVCPNELDFCDSKIACSAKKTSEIIRALVVFKLCSINYLVDNNKKIIKICRKVAGKNLFEYIMKKTVYGHFVAGATQEDIKDLVKLNRKFGVKSILDYSVEEDITEDKAKKIAKDTMNAVLDQEEKAPNALDVKFQTNLAFANRSDHVTGARTYFYTSEDQCDENMKIIKKCIDASAYTSSEGEGFTALKFTALGPPQLLMHMSDILVQLQAIFNSFTQNKTPSGELKFDLKSFQDRLKDLKIEISYDEQLKWFTLLDTNKDNNVDLFEWLNLKNFEHNLAKLFQIKDPESGKITSLIKPLSKDGIQSMRRMLQRLDEIAEYAKMKNSRVMIDAEQSYFQPAIRRIALELMRRFNKDRAIIFNTYQCYLKDALEHVSSDLVFAEQEKFYFGAKLVRGAYMDQERERAHVLKYTDPINPTFEATTNMYCSCMDAAFDSILKRPRGQVLIMIASHNIDTIKTAMKKLDECSIYRGDKLICFGQLLGMCDHISFTLGRLGYSVYKYMPYGPVSEVLPYLSRRALENRAVLEKSTEEQTLLWQELIRRCKTRTLTKYPAING